MRKYVCKDNVSCLRQVYASCSDVVNPTFCAVDNFTEQDVGVTHDFEDEVQVLSDIDALEGQVCLHAQTSKNSCSNTPLEHICDGVPQTETANGTVDPGLKNEKS